MNVITGASGLIGSNLVRALLEENQPVRALVHRSQESLAGLDIETAPGDILSPDSLAEAFSGAQVVYHLAGAISLSMRDWERVERVNVQGTRSVVRACLQAGVRRLVHFSSIHALEQEPFDTPVDESRPRASAPHYPPYDRSKALGELEVLKGVEQGLDAVILNPSGVIGPWDYGPSHFGQGLILIARGWLPALVAGGFDWVDARDAAAAAIQAARHGVCGENYLVCGHWRSVRQIAETAGEFSGHPAPKFTAPRRLAVLGIPLTAGLAALTGKTNIFTRATLMALDSNQQIDCSKAAQAFDYRPRPFRQTIFDTLAWFTEHGYLPAKGGQI